MCLTFESQLPWMITTYWVMINCKFKTGLIHDKEGDENDPCMCLDSTNACFRYPQIGNCTCNCY
jgi:hypothetical protein